MIFSIDSADALEINDAELTELLIEVYVGGGYSDLNTASRLFEATAVRQRGQIIVARENEQSQLAGVVINVSFESPARRFANANEIEMHLLSVKPKYRGNGLGKKLIEASIIEANINGYSKMILWTQKTMKTAHRLYKLTGFVHLPEKDFTRNNREFLFYEQMLKS